MPLDQIDSLKQKSNALTYLNALVCEALTMNPDTGLDLIRQAHPAMQTPAYSLDDEISQLGRGMKPETRDFSDAIKKGAKISRQGAKT